MRARNPSLQKPFLVTAFFGAVASVAGGAQAAPANLPGSRPVDPVVKRADGTCWQAVAPCPAGVCAPDAATRQVRCPPPALRDPSKVRHHSVRPNGVCFAFMGMNCPPPDCPDGPDRPCRLRATCNPPPPRPVPCEGEGDASQIVMEGAQPTAPRAAQPAGTPASAAPGTPASAAPGTPASAAPGTPASAPASAAEPPPKPTIERNPDGTCTAYPHIPADFRCPEGATCNPPMPYPVECPPTR